MMWPVEMEKNYVSVTSGDVLTKRLCRKPYQGSIRGKASYWYIDLKNLNN